MGNDLDSGMRVNQARRVMKRLEVRIDDGELREIQRIARERGMTTSEWVRASLHAALPARGEVSRQAKLEAVRKAMKYSFPVGDIDQILAEIEG
jgi:hypothetical protein